MNWKVKAKRLWSEVKRRAPEAVGELIDRNYSGAGGCVHPDSTIRPDLAADDVAYEQLAADCTDVLSGKS